MDSSDIKSRPGKPYSSITCDSEGNVFDFGGWESEEAKLRHNLTWSPEQILDWLEGVNRFKKEIRENTNVL